MTNLPRPDRSRGPYQLVMWCAALLGAMLLAQHPLDADAQARVSVPAPVASAPTQPASGPRLMSPQAVRDSATAPGSLRPERPALPQVRVQLGKPAAEPAASSPAPVPPKPAPSAGAKP